MKFLATAGFYIWGFICFLYLSALEGCDPLAHRDPATMPSIWPVSLKDGYVSSEFGKRVHPVSGKRKMHQGMDLAVDEGTPVVATADGIVIAAGEEKGYGQIIRVDHSEYLVSCYAHNSRLLVSEGDYVKKGQIIAISGKSGVATGEHLHYEVRYKDNPMNPRRFLPNP